MAHWTASSTQANLSVETSLKVVDGVMSYMKDTQGKPAAKERALYAAAVVFTGQRQLFLPIDDNYTYPWFSLPLGE